LLLALRRGEHVRAYRVWATLQSGGGATRPTFEASVRLLASRAAAAEASGEGGGSASVVAGLSVFCGSEPAACGPLLDLAASGGVEEREAAMLALWRGLGRTGSLEADRLLGEAKGTARAASASEGKESSSWDDALALVERAAASAPASAAPWSLAATIHRARGRRRRVESICATRTHSRTHRSRLGGSRLPHLHGGG